MSGKTGPPQDNPIMSRLRLALERELRASETVVWHGWQLGRLEPLSFGIYIFAVPWTAFSVMWTVLASGAAAMSGDDGPGWIGWAFPLFGLPFIAIGLALLARPFVPLFQKGRVLYVVTNERALKLSMGRELAVETVPADRIGLIQRFERRDGSGRLQLAVKIGKDSDGDRQTDYFEIGNVPDVMGAQEALHRISVSTTTASALAKGQANTLSS